ncbi:retropepsin-like aspartic protease family protein [Rhodoplanes sp. Z2-YC6860]|uniref:retropepsin-like aspartic protease family protein n=1 Tax=Rhodoplanes sp. Z2-YC6860 TaxID=674703 RepID=UPI00078C19BA|nr:TIGR02281 family clan AA aspartic protease [Rhodoplanes sp. Z2-YC6860]AMN45138.1 TIGR02281 family clan AA aspartic protease [Rhodoplanes sp. Z2-YC6860]
MRQVVYAFIFMVVAGLAVVHQLDRSRSGNNGANALAMATKKPAAPEPASSSSNNYRTVTLVSDRRGYFQTDVQIDGRRIEFLVDTGAQSVALRESDAARLGIHPSARDYNIRTQTANGVGRAARTRLNRVELKGITIYDVEAIVVPDEQLSTNLLGMTFLSRVKWTHEHGRLVLEQ